MHLRNIGTELKCTRGRLFGRGYRFSTLFGQERDPRPMNVRFQGSGQNEPGIEIERSVDVLDRK